MSTQNIYTKYMQLYGRVAVALLRGAAGGGDAVQPGRLHGPGGGGAPLRVREVRCARLQILIARSLLTSADQLSHIIVQIDIVCM